MVKYNARMFHVSDVLHLEKDEALEGLFRKHSATLAIPFLIALVCIVVPFFFLFPLFRSGALGIVFFCVSVFAGICIALRAMYIWDAEANILTNRRLVIVKQEGLFSREVTEIQFATLRDVSWDRKGMWEALWQMGTVHLRSRNEELPIHLLMIPRPEQFVDIFRQRLSASSADVLPVIEKEVISEPLPKEEIAMIAEIHEPSGDHRRKKMDEIVNLLGRSSDEELERFAIILRARESERSES